MMKHPVFHCFPFYVHTTINGIVSVTIIALVLRRHYLTGVSSLSSSEVVSLWLSVLA